MPDRGLIELEAIIAVSRLGGFRAAAREVGISASAVSQAVASLERRLDIRLFNRTTRSVALTPAGEAFVAEIGPALDTIQAAMDGVDHYRAEPSGVLRLNMPLSFSRLIQPLVYEYLGRYPQMGVEIETNNRLVDIVATRFDAGLRFTDSIPGEMVAVPVDRNVRFLVAGSAEYFERHGIPLMPADLMQHRCIRGRLQSGAIYLWEFERNGQTFELDVPGPLTLNESSLMIDAAVAGVGLTYQSRSAMAAPLSAGLLRPVLEEWSPSYPTISLYYPGRRLVHPKLRAFIDLIRERDTYGPRPST